MVSKLKSVAHYSAAGTVHISFTSSSIYTSTLLLIRPKQRTMVHLQQKSLRNQAAWIHATAAAYGLVVRQRLHSNDTLPYCYTCTPPASDTHHSYRLLHRYGVESSNFILIINAINFILWRIVLFI